MYLLGHFKEPLRNKVRDFIIPKVRNWGQQSPRTNVSEISTVAETNRRTPVPMLQR
jgi:hypothetical protein